MAQNKRFRFGTGNVYGIQLTDASGVAVAAPTPAKFGTLQDISFDISFTNKELRGQNQFAESIARAGGKISGKAKFGQFDVPLLNSLFFGQTVTTGQTLVADGEAASIPASPYSITVANAATFKDDLGVVDVLTGTRLTRVASAPAAGQYTVSAVGVYLFAAADTTKAVLISYSYTAVTGTTISVTNQLMGYAPTFKLECFNPYGGGNQMVTLYNCISSKFSMPFKNEDYSVPEFDFDAFADGVTGKVFDMSQA